METIEIRSDSGLIGFVIRSSGSLVSTTTFVTPHQANLQVGFIRKSPVEAVPRHDHKPFERHLVGTSEVLVVQQGSGEIDFFDEDRRFLTSHQFAQGDVLVMLAGGHGLRFAEETVLLEVKQGPYPGVDEKERF